MDDRREIPVVVDTCVLVNLIHVRRLDLLGAISGYRFCTVNHVVNEVVREPQRKTLRKAIAEGLLEEIEITDQAEIRAFAACRNRFDAGESACMAVAAARGWAIATDERTVKTRMQSRLGTDRILDTPMILVLAIRQGRLTVEAADRIKDELEEKHFKMRIESFRDLV